LVLKIIGRKQLLILPILLNPALGVMTVGVFRWTAATQHGRVVNTGIGINRFRPAFNDTPDGSTDTAWRTLRDGIYTLVFQRGFKDYYPIRVRVIHVRSAGTTGNTKTSCQQWAPPPRRNK
jgi:hypothetical protein